MYIFYLLKRSFSRIAAIVSLALTALLLVQAQEAGRNRWTSEQANAWYASEPWLVGSNYIPAYAANELEMWQADTFDPKRINKELGWAEGLGMNTMRVFLHDLLWEQDKDGFKQRIDEFLKICAKHKIRPLFVLFDSVWDPLPQLGKQPAPRPGIHNSRWVQSPGARALADPSQYPRLEAYVEGVVGAFEHDRRILGWDIWNEPDNTNDSSYGKTELPNKVQPVLALLRKAFAWAREAGAQQPLTSGVWHGDWSDPEKLEPMAKEQLELSDIVSFHNYGVPNDFEKRVHWLQQYGRPLICTEYMARGEKSTFEGILPIAKTYKVGAINWGFVRGKTQTYLPWDSWQQPYVYRAPTVWFHDIFYGNGRPYRPAEVAFIRKMTGKSAQ
jgi:Cellulase (glycosyl hydrolase family 5)